MTPPRRLKAARDRNHDRGDRVLGIVREIRDEVDDLWLDNRHASPQIRTLCQDLASFEDTSAKRTMNALRKGLTA